MWTAAKRRSRTKKDKAKQAKVRTSFFEKKEAKKLLVRFARVLTACGQNPREADQKFFARFFSKKRFFLTY